jgi:hypothetical protein
MTVDTAREHAPARTEPWEPWLALGLALLGATSHLAALALPHDTALEWLVWLLAVYSFALAPIVGFGVAAWSAHRLWADRREPSATTVWLVAMVVASASFCWIFTPLAEELRTWLQD